MSQLNGLYIYAMPEQSKKELFMEMFSENKTKEEAEAMRDRYLARYGYRSEQPQIAGLGIVSIRGALGNNWWGTNYQDLSLQIESYEKDPSVNRILFDVNSPGGDVSGLIELSEIIAKVEKPISVYGEVVCASAAYLLATTGSKIYATPQTKIGSIGVMGSFIDDSKYMEKMGLKEVVFRSKNASKKNLDPNTEEGKAEIEKSINELETLFIAKIANNRGVSSEDVIAKFGQGLTFHAQEAMEKGMVDEIVSDFDACVERIMPSSVGGGGVVMAQEKTEVPMTAELLKAQHPESAKAIAEEGRVAGLKEGADAERTRIAELGKLRKLACGAEIVDMAISNGTSVADAQGAIIKKQVEAAESGTVTPVASNVVALEELADESAGANVNPVVPVVEATKTKEELEIDAVVAAMNAVEEVK
jgi:signal peptide peptidase SppA